jgi:peptide chain release factor 2
LASKEKTLSQFEKEIEAPDFWSNPSQAQQVMKQYNITKAEVDSWRAFSRRLHDALELAQLEDESLRLELETEISAIESELEKRSFTAMLSGKYDHDCHPCYPCWSRWN